MTGSKERSTSSPGAGKFDGQVALVTGAALGPDGGSGMGGATAQLLSTGGAKVVCVDIDGDAARRLADRIVADGGDAIGVAVDLGDVEATRTVVSVAVERYGGLDMLVNVAAALGPDVLGRDIEVVSMDQEVWDRTFAVNLTGPMVLCKHAIPAMLEKGAGAIVNVSAAAGLLGHVIRPAYAMSKAALNMLTMSIATTYGHRGIRCNSVCPGAVMTPAGDRITSEMPAIHDVMVRQTPSPRFGTSGDIASAIAYLLSGDAAFVNGQLLAVDGGLTAHIAQAGEFRELLNAT